MRYLVRIVILSVIIGYAKAHSFIKLVILAGLGLAGLFMIHTLAMDFNNIIQNGFSGSAGHGIASLQEAGHGLTAVFKNTFGNNEGGYVDHHEGPKLFDGHGKLYDEQEMKNVYKRSELEAKYGKNVVKRTTKVDENNGENMITSETTNIQRIYKRSVAEGKSRGINWQLVLSRDPASCARSFICQLEATKDADRSKEDRIILDLTKSSTEDSSWASKQIQEALKTGRSVTYPYQCMKQYKFCPYTKNMMMTLLKFFSGSSSSSSR